MRREGKVSGYIKGRRSSNAIRERKQELQDLGLHDLLQVSDSWPRLKVTNKPTNESKDSGRCRRKACRGCHSCPPSKALSKTKGQRNKLSKAGLTFLADPAWALPGCSIAQKQCLTGNPYLHIDPDCYSDYGSNDDYNVQDHHFDVQDQNDCYNKDGSYNDFNVQDHHFDGHYVIDDDHNVDDGDHAPLVVLNDDVFPPANDCVVGDDHDIHVVCSDILPKQLQQLGNCPQILQSSPDSDLDVDDDASIEWYKVVASDTESNEDEWYLC